MQPFGNETIAQTLSSDDIEHLKNAGEKCRAILKNNPRHAVFLHLMGIIEYQLGNIDPASTWIKKGLIIIPDSAEMLCTYANILTAQKNHAEAAIAFRRSIALKPNFAQAYCDLAGMFKECSDDANAMKAYNDALAIDPNNSKALNNFGLILKNNGALVEAENCFRRANATKPDYPVPLNILGFICFSLGDTDLAEAFFRRALALKPDYPSALNNLGIILYNRGAFEDCVSLYKRALALQPELSEVLNNLGSALKQVGKLPEAIGAYEQAIALNGNYPDYHNNLAMTLLGAGRFEEGWRNFEWRWKSTQFADAQQNSSKPLWHGEAAQGRIMLIRAEQGFGDTLQFCRYAPMAAARGLRVVLEVQPALVRLMRSVADIEQVVAQGQPLPDFDLYCPMMSLPAAFDTRLETIPDNVPYLSVDDESVNAWRNRLPDGYEKKLKVGLVWTGKQHLLSPNYVAADRRRSIAPDLLAPLVDIDSVQFYSLQKDGPPAPKEFGLIDFMNECGDFADTAALVKCLDLVISVDTAVVHLAGALGKPVWVLNRYDSCWRWLQTREDSPWYPTLRLFRQQSPGDWKSVLSRVKNSLMKIVGNRTNAHHMEK